MFALRGFLNKLLRGLLGGPAAPHAGAYEETRLRPSAPPGWQSKSAPPPFLRAGIEQVENLIKSRVQFLLLDVRDPNSASGARFPQAVHVTPTTLLEITSTKASDKSFPIVLICETGAHSSQAATQLTAVGYLNVVVVDQGR